MMLAAANIFLWGTGVLWLLFSKRARNFRFLGVFYVLFLALMMALHAKDYYLAPAYPVFFAAGGIAWSAWTNAKAWRNTLMGVYAAVLIAGIVAFFPFSVPVLPPQQWLAYAEKLHFKPHDSENHDATPLPQFFADRFGWHELVDQVTQIYNSLPPEERAVTGVYAGNYGQASAINILGKQYGLPTAISGHQNYWIWGPRGYTGEEMIIINEATPEEMSKYYASCTVVGKRDHPYAMPWEHGPIYLCRGRKTAYEADWIELKHYY
jgi:hypothetical protein